MRLFGKTKEERLFVKSYLWMEALTALERKQASPSFRTFQRQSCRGFSTMFRGFETQLRLEKRSAAR
jgi:hypothetical protein